jgi:hypothetical protein
VLAVSQSFVRSICGELRATSEEKCWLDYRIVKARLERAAHRHRGDFIVGNYNIPGHHAPVKIGFCISLDELANTLIDRLEELGILIPVAWRTPSNDFDPDPINRNTLSFDGYDRRHDGYDLNHELLDVWETAGLLALSD